MSDLIEKLLTDLRCNSSDIVDCVLVGIVHIILLMTLPLWLPFWLFDYFNRKV